jgi:hypothetical protein
MSWLKGTCHVYPTTISDRICRLGPSCDGVMCQGGGSDVGGGGAGDFGHEHHPAHHLPRKTAHAFHIDT